MPFENVTREGRFFWLTEAAAVLLTDDLNALGAGAITRTERQQAFERLQVPPASVLTDATVIRIGQLVGASQVVVGSLQMESDAVVVRARSIALDTGRVSADVTERGPLPELFATFERIARRMAPPSATTSADVEKQHPPVTVFEAFIKGLLAETPATAISYLRAALAGQPSFDRARLALVGRLRRAGRARAGAGGRRVGAGRFALVHAARGFSPASRNSTSRSTTMRSRRSRRWPTASRRRRC